MTESSRIEYKQATVLKKPLPNPPLIREGSKKDAPPSCASPDKGRLGGVSSFSPVSKTLTPQPPLPEVEGEQESVFEIRESYLRVTFPYREGFTTNAIAGKTADKILTILQTAPNTTAKALAEELEVSLRTVETEIASLKKQGLIVRMGGAKGGYWEVLNHGE